MAVIDESRKFQKQWLQEIIAPSLRGFDELNAKEWNTDMYLGLYDFTSGAWMPEEQFIYETEELARKDPKNYYFGECTAYDNPRTGQDFVEQCRRTMDDVTFAVEILNERIMSRPDGFYNALSDSVHLLRDVYDYTHTTRQDYKPDRPLAATLDFNVDFISASILQKNLPFHYVCNVLTRKYPKEGHSMPESLALDFCEFYKDHTEKEVTIYGDPSGKSRTITQKLQNGTLKDAFDEFEDICKIHGWTVKRKLRRSHTPHKEKHQVINEALTETKRDDFKLRISHRYSYHLYISMRNSPIDVEHRKVKTSEKKAIAQEFATHLSDNIDEYILSEYTATKRHLTIMRIT